MNSENMNLKLEIVQQYQKGKSVISLVKEYNIPRNTIYSWIKAYERIPQNSDIPVTIQDYNSLTAMYVKQKNIISIMKATTLDGNATTREKVFEIQQLASKEEYSINELCEALSISKNTYYRHIKKGNEVGYTEKRRLDYSKLIRQIFEDHNQMIGSEKIAAILKSEGYPTTQQYVKERMNEMGLVSMRVGSKKYYKSLQKKKENIVNQQFKVSAPNELWVSDITEFKFKGSIYKLCVIMDVYSRKLISYKLSLNSSTQILTSSMRIALNTRETKSGLIFHSDNGGQYLSYAFRKLINGNGIIQSFSRPHNPYDNSIVESFFSNFKQEEFYRRNYSSVQDLIMSLDRYMIYYNSKRPHTSINNLTPETKKMNTIKKG